MQNDEKQPTVASPIEPGVMCFDDGADKTDNIEGCGNKGCGFNSSGNCTASGTECFGYIDPRWD
jgi:hypothetical protein